MSYSSTMLGIKLSFPGNPLSRSPELYTYRAQGGPYKTLAPGSSETREPPDRVHAFPVKTLLFPSLVEKQSWRRRERTNGRPSASACEGEYCMGSVNGYAVAAYVGHTMAARRREGSDQYEEGGKSCGQSDSVGSGL